MSQSVGARHGRALLFKPHAWASLAAVALLTAILLAALLRGVFSLDVGDLAPLYALTAVFIVAGSIARYRRLSYLDDLLQVTGVFYLVAIQAALSCAVLTRTSLPYCDDALEAADKALGFDWLAMMSSFQSHPWLASLLSRAYSTLNWQPQLAIFLLCAFRPPVARYRFLTAWAACLFLTTITYPFFPAIAAFHHYGVDPATMPVPSTWASWHLPDLMEQLRSGKDTVLDAGNLTGLVTMPSFHAAAAIMLLWTFWAFRWLRWPFAVLNLVMFASAVPVGGHYLVDTLAGLVLAVVAIAFATQVHTPPATTERGDTPTLQPAMS